MLGTGLVRWAFGTRPVFICTPTSSAGDAPAWPDLAADRLLGRSSAKMNWNWAGERRVLEVLNDTGKTIYLGDTAHAQSVVRPFGWTLSKDKARESARRRHAKDKPGVVYTGELERNGTWLYLEGGIGQEVAVNPDCLTITAEEWIAE